MRLRWLTILLVATGCLVMNDGYQPPPADLLQTRDLRSGAEPDMSVLRAPDLAASPPADMTLLPAHDLDQAASCDPEWNKTSGCGAGLACRLSSSEPSACQSAGNGGDGSACITDSECVAGTACTQGGTCRHVCIAGNGDCDVAQTCTSVAGWAPYGLCCPVVGPC